MKVKKCIGEDGEREGVMLQDAFPSLFQELVLALGSKEEKLQTQLASVFLPVQHPAGGQNDFRLRAFVLPMLTPDEARVHEFAGESSVETQLAAGSIAIQMDDFGRVESLRFVKSPNCFMDWCQICGRSYPKDGVIP